MTPPVSIGTCIVFKNGYGDFCANRPYAVIAQQTNRILFVEINFNSPSVAKHVRSLGRVLIKDLEQAGLLTISALPDIPSRGQIKPYSKSKFEAEGPTTEEAYALVRFESLRPLIEAREKILGDLTPERRCNELARSAGLNVTRARWQFFWLAAYSFDPLALKRAYWNSGRQSQQQHQSKLSNLPPVSELLSPR